MQQPVTTVVQLDTKPTGEVGVADVLLGSIALIGFLILAALLVGLATGGIFIALRKWRESRSPEGTEESPHTSLNLSAH
jgi:ABC-type phosphate transport system permease subunit